MLLWGRQTHRNLNDISEHAGSHYFCSTRQHIVRLSRGLHRLSHETISAMPSNACEPHHITQQQTCFNDEQQLPWKHVKHLQEVPFKFRWCNITKYIHGNTVLKNNFKPLWFNTHSTSYIRRATFYSFIDLLFIYLLYLPFIVTSYLEE